MVVSLGIFKAGNCHSLWLGSAETLAEAVQFMRNRGEGVYFVFSQESSEKKFYRVAGDGIVSPVDFP
jgi:hypothetical protein